MDLPAAFDFVERTVCSGTPLAEGLARILEYNEKTAPGQPWAQLRTYPLDEDVSELKSSLQMLLSFAPPPPHINVLWFGLPDTADAQFSLIGSSHYTKAQDAEVLINLDFDYRPHEGTFTSGFLASVSALIATLPPDVQNFTHYTLRLGYVALLTAEFARTGLLYRDKKTLLVTGFNGGDYILVGTVVQDAFTPGGE